MTPTATRLKMRLEDRYTWFRNQWFFKWHQIGADQSVEIDLFNGSMAYYGGFTFSGTARDVYWEAIVRGVRKEIITQFLWVESQSNNMQRGLPKKRLINAPASLSASPGRSAERLSRRIASCGVTASNFLLSATSAIGKAPCRTTLPNKDRPSRVRCFPTQFPRLPRC